MSTKISEPPKGSLFTFKNYGCKCNVEKHYEDDGSESYWLQITTDKDKEIELYHSFKDGLYRSDADVEKSKDVVHELPKSSDLKKLSKCFLNQGSFSLKSIIRNTHCNDEEYALEVKAFFERYGFLFPLSERVSLFSVKELSCFFDRLYVVSQLISEIKSSRQQFGFNYNKIFSYVFILALSDNRSILDWKHENRIVYTIPKHPLARTLDSIPEKCNRPIKRIFRGQHKVDHYELLINAFEEYDLKLKETGPKTNYENLGNFADDTYQAFKSLEESLNDSTVCFIINDYFSDEYVGSVHGFYGDNDEAIDATIKADQFSMKILESYYENMDQDNRRDKLFVDFLIHFNNELSPIIYIERKDFCPILYLEDIDFNNYYKFNDRYKEILLELARITLKNELDEILKFVLPKFDEDEMAPGWHVPDLFTAINYSLFLNAGNEKIEKVCANPTCYQTFSVEIGNSKHKYCSDSCSNCMRQRRHKANKAARDASKIALTNS